MFLPVVEFEVPSIDQLEKFVATVDAAREKSEVGCLWFDAKHIECNFKANILGNIQRYTPITLYPTAPLYNIIIIFDTILRQKRDYKHEKEWIQQRCHLSSLAWTANALRRPD